MGDMPDWKTRRSIELFATRVMSQLRSFWPEHGGERFWIRPLDERVVPAQAVALREDG
jgi:hypothetical protein